MSFVYAERTEHTFEDAPIRSIRVYGDTKLQDVRMNGRVRSDGNARRAGPANVRNEDGGDAVCCNWR